MKKILIFIIAVFSLTINYAFHSRILKNDKIMNEQKEYPKALVNFEDFKTLVAKVENHRIDRLISLDTFF